MWWLAPKSPEEILAPERARGRAYLCALRNRARESRFEDGFPEVDVGEERENSVGGEAGWKDGEIYEAPDG